MSRRRAGLLCAALVVAPLVAMPPTYAAPDGADEVPTAAVPETVHLDEPAHGREAIRQLGDDLDVAAAINGMTEAELRDLLLDDRTAWVDGYGKVFFIEPEPPPIDPAVADLAVPEAIDPADAFLLHSKPGSQHVIYLDFDGHLVSGTAWNASGVSSTTHPAWTLDGDSATFSTTERNAISSIWSRVAEDYAPFDVDVTTADPGAAAISRTNAADPTYGTRVLISPSSQAITALCGGSCGGVAYLDVFDVSEPDHAFYQPAWVFPQALSHSTKSIAEAATHEAGHNLALSHDSVNGTGYYGGHAMWAPIMGVGYNRPVVQWSKGDYPTGTNKQDDVAIIAASGAPYRVDEAGGTVGTAAAITASTTYITTRADVDVWAIGTCAGAVTLAANPAPTSPNLDIELQLLSAGGAVVGTANPASAASTSDVATGMNASISTSLASGQYFLRVDGVGNGTWTNGYDDYASIGAYTLSTTGCGGGGVDPVAPAEPTGLNVVPAANGQSATFTWAPGFDGGSPITGYVVQRTGASSQSLGPSATSHVFSGLTPGASYTFSVAAVNAIGTGSAATVDATIPVPVSPPSAPQDLVVTVHAAARTADVQWNPPASAGGGVLFGYYVSVDGVQVDDVTQGTHLLLTGLTRGRTYDVAVRAHNAAGPGPSAETSFAVPAAVTTAPSAPRIGAAKPGKKGGKSNATASWQPPVSTGGAAVTRYVVYAYRIKKGTTVATVLSQGQAASVRSLRMRLPKGRYKFAVKAKNAVGWSPLSARSATVRAR